jgi:hypothetical protein
MATTYEFIASASPSGVHSVTLSNIPQTYDDLLVQYSLRSDYGNAGHEGYFTFNSVSSGYGQVLLVGDGSAVNTYGPQSGQAAATWAIVINGASATSNTFSNGEIYLPNYSSTTLAKSWSSTAVTENNATTALTWMVAGRNTSTAAISSLTFYAWQSFINFVSGSQIYLYGIKKS